MDHSLSQLQSLLLDLLSTKRHVDAHSIAALSDQDWAALVNMARQHRLLPMLHWRLTRERSDLRVPESVSEALQQDFKRSAMRALLMQRELLVAHRVLEQAGIPLLALKGAYLAFHAYPHPALRPMRDLDILVPRERALSTYQALMENGFTQPTSSRQRGDLHASLENNRHLPPLFSSAGLVRIEVHARLSVPRSDRPVDLADTPGLWERKICQPISGETLCYLSPTDQLLHLILHAVYDHRFDNGPLVFSDVAYLLETTVIDWSLFWQKAEEGGWTSGCILLLKMTERFLGAQHVIWPDIANGGLDELDDLVESASLLTLRHFMVRMVALRSDVLNQPTIGGKIKFLMKSVFPPKKGIASRYPVSEDSPWLYVWYFVYWWRIFTIRLPQLAASAGSEHNSDEARRISRLDKWLKDNA